jgi:Putative restriction endonuclease
MGSPAMKIKQSYTYEDYLTWPDDERWEIIDGEAHAMTPAPTTRHQQIIRKLITRLDHFFNGKPCENHVNRSSPLPTWFLTIGTLSSRTFW